MSSKPQSFAFVAACAGAMLGTVAVAFAVRRQEPAPAPRVVVVRRPAVS